MLEANTISTISNVIPLVIAMKEQKSKERVKTLQDQILTVKSRRRFEYVNLPAYNELTDGHQRDFQQYREKLVQGLEEVTKTKSEIEELRRYLLIGTAL